MTMITKDTSKLPLTRYWRNDHIYNQVVVQCLLEDFIKCNSCTNTVFQFSQKYTVDQNVKYVWCSHILFLIIAKISRNELMGDMYNISIDPNRCELTFFITPYNMYNFIPIHVLSQYPCLQICTVGRQRRRRGLDYIVICYLQIISIVLFIVFRF